MEIFVGLVAVAGIVASAESVVVSAEFVAIAAMAVAAAFAESKTYKSAVTSGYQVTMSSAYSRSSVSPTRAIPLEACSYSEATALVLLSGSPESECSECSECSDSRGCSTEPRSWELLWSLLWSRLSVVPVASLELERSNLELQYFSKR